MPTQNEVLVKFRADASELVSGTQKIIDQFRLINETLQLSGKASLADVDLKNIETSARQSAAQIQILAQRLELLNQIRQRGEGSRARIPISPEEQQATGLVPGRTGVSRAQIREAELATIQEGNRLLDQRAQLEQRSEGIARNNLEVSQALLNSSTKRQFIEEKLASIASGELEGQIVQSRIDALQRVHDQLVATREEIRSQVSQQLGRARGGRIERDREQAEDRVLKARQRIEQIDRQIQSTQGRAQQERIRGTQQQAVLEERLLQLQSRRVTLVAQESRARRDLAIAEAQQDAGADVTGARQHIEELNRLINENQEEQFQAFRGGIAAVAPEYAKLRQELIQNLQITERSEEVERRKFQIIQQLRDLERRARTDNLPTDVTPEAFAQRQLASLPALERTLFTAFDDVGRRFRTALQFALSGAVIFAAQRLVREFFQAAIEVERTFADIESALEFDLADEGIERGTVEFDRRVESIRRSVLQLANDFNVLPSSANDAAFKMVARFSDSEDALKAIRAQFLATKISTIDQDEAIRALSATAEGFADSVLTANNSLTLQERLLAREKAAAEGYAGALDEAVLIQQRFGVEVEDTLEGTARLAQTFSQLGFSRQQTEATVSAVSRELGLPGSQVAEKLNRAFGAITQPETRDKLLELAAASETLNLSLEDFRSGADLVRALDAQFSTLEQREPQTALQLRDIIGQRRETEVVAAFFGTTDLRRAIEVSLRGAAGAAETRFGFLAETISEKIQSIIAQFESLAQNFERLQLFGPVKAFLTGIDAGLTAVNALLQALQNIVGTLDDIGAAFGLKIGTSLKNIVVTALSLLAILRATAATMTVISVARAGVAQAGGVAGVAAQGGGLLAALAPVIGGLTQAARDAGGGFRGIVAAASQVGSSFAYAAKNLANWTGIMLNAIPGMQRFSSGLSLSNTALGGWALGIVAAAAVIHNFISEGARAIENLRSFQQIPQEAEIATRRQEILEPFASPQERELFRTQQELDTIIARSQEQVRGGLATFFTSLFPIFDETTRNELGLLGSIGITAGTAFGAGGTPDELVPLSQAWWEAKVREAEDAFALAQIDVVSADIGRLRGGTNDQGERRLVSDLERGLRSTLRQFQNAETDEEREAALLAISDLQVSYEEVVARLGLTYDGIASSTSGIIRQGDQLGRDVQLGRVSATDAPEEHLKLAEEARRQAEELRSVFGENTPEIVEEIDRLLAFADAQTLASVDARQRMFQRQFARLSRITQPAARLEAQIKVLENELQYLRDSGLAGTERELDVLDRISELRHEMANAARESASAISRRRIELARTLAEWVSAMEAYIKAIGESIRTIRIPLPFAPGGAIEIPDPNDIVRAVDEMLKGRKEIEERLDREAVAVAEARTRLGGPIKSRITQIEARIRGLKTRISQGFFSPGEALAAQVELSEAIADRIEAEAEAAAGWIRLQAGVGDSIRSLQAELTIVTKQLDITAQLYGRQSAQYLQLKLSQDQLRQRLVEAQLELEDLNRRLDSDITNDFEQAQLDLVEIMRKLSQLDLGPLEKARLELEKVQAEAAAEKAFFDDRLFQLRFDFETGEIGLSTYISSLRGLLENVDTSTKQGKEIFLEISSLIDSLTDDVSDFQFNIPSSIRLPTLFEVRRALAADQLGVTYQDNRTQTINLEVNDPLTLEQVILTIDRALGDVTGKEARRSAVGGAGIAPIPFTA